MVSFFDNDPVWREDVPITINHHNYTLIVTAPPYNNQDIHLNKEVNFFLYKRNQLANEAKRIDMDDHTYLYYPVSRKRASHDDDADDVNENSIKRQRSDHNYPSQIASSNIATATSSAVHPTTSSSNTNIQDYSIQNLADFNCCNLYIFPTSNNDQEELRVENYSFGASNNIPNNEFIATNDESTNFNSNSQNILPEQDQNIQPSEFINTDQHLNQATTTNDESIPQSSETLAFLHNPFNNDIYEWDVVFDGVSGDTNPPAATS